MSKKKVMPRSTMTLKDFHGGSIPSDLQLPSAPGMTVDRAAYDRQGNTWNVPRGYGSDRHRAGIRILEDKPSYFPNPANIGRNYDEDERGRPHSSGGESGADAGRRAPFAAGAPAVPTRDYANGRLQPYASDVGRAQQASSRAGEPVPNAWALRREAEYGRLTEAATHSPLRSNMAMLADASAIDKLSSGRWQPEHRYATDDSRKDVVYAQHNSLQNQAQAENEEGPSRAEKRLSSDYIRRGHADARKDPIANESRLPSDESFSPAHASIDRPYRRYASQSDLVDHSGDHQSTASPEFVGGPASASADGKTVTGERPKLKLLPRSKGHPEEHAPQSDVVSDARASQEVEAEPSSERPKLNLKPRSQPVAVLDHERQSPFGGARPRELVLKQRAGDDGSSSAPIAATSRDSDTVSRGERKYRVSDNSVRKDSIPEQQERGKVASRWEQDSEAAGGRRERQEGGRRDIDKQDSWRRPAEVALAPSRPTASTKYGVAASAVDLALAFSRSSGVISPQDSFENTFSRLTTASTAAREYGVSGRRTVGRRNGF